MSNDRNKKKKLKVDISKFKTIREEGQGWKHEEKA